MIRKSKRCISLLLIAVLLVGIVPTAYATETATSSTASEETTSEVTEATEPLDPTEPTEPTAPPENEDFESADLPAMSEAEDFALMSIGSTQNSIMLFDYADNGNYTTVLNSQVSCSYKPNGTGTTRTAYIKNLGWHFARYGGVAYPDDPLYCIEPWRSYGASTSGNSVDRDVTLDGSGSTSGSNVWYALPTARREAIGLILLYSDQMWDHSISVTTTKKDSNPNVPLCRASSSNLNAYFTLKAVPQVGNISLTKTTEDGKNLSGWRFGIYSNSACTSLVSGPHTTNSSGKISVTGLSAGTYYVKELGHTDSSINVLYTCSSTNPQRVTVTSGGTASVSFYNKLNTCGLSLTKTTEDGKNLAGWGFGIYSDAACTSLASGPHTTDSKGAISVTGLPPGTVYVKELGHTDSAINLGFISQCVLRSVSPMF